MDSNCKTEISLAYSGIYIYSASQLFPPRPASPEKSMLLPQLGEFFSFLSRIVFYIYIYCDSGLETGSVSSDDGAEAGDLDELDLEVNLSNILVGISKS